MSFLDALDLPHWSAEPIMDEFIAPNSGDVPLSRAGELASLAELEKSLNDVEFSEFFRPVEGD